MPVLRKESVVDRLREIVASVLELNEDEVQSEASFYEDLGADSLEKVEITSRIESDFDVRLTAAEAAEVTSVTDAVALLQRKGAAEDGIDLVERLVGRHLAAGRGAAPAYLDPDLHEVSFARLHEAIRGYAGAVRVAGVPAGARCLIVAEDSVATVVAVLGLWRAGCVPVLMTPMATGPDLAFVARDCSARMVHIDVAAAKQRALGTTFDQLVRLTGDDVRQGLRTGTPTAAHRPDDAPGEALSPPDAEALVQYTSGSTGRPKGVRHSAAGIGAMLDGFGPVMGLRDDDVVLSTARMSFGYGFGSSILCPLDTGACTVLIRGAVDAQVVAAAVQRHRPTVLCSVPRLYAALLDAAEREQGGDFGTLRLCLCAGEYCPESLAERITAGLGADLMICLGATEFMHVVLATRPGRFRPGSVGFPVPGLTLTVRDEKGLPVPEGAEGRLHVAGPTVALGYLNRPEEDATTFADGGAYSNDLVRRAADGSVDYLCRADDMLNLGGYKVTPGEIESVVRASEGVADCRVVSGKDANGLEQAVVYAVADPGVQVAQARRAVMASIRKELAAYKRPARIEFLDDLPLSTTGKVATYKLREREARP